MKTVIMVAVMVAALTISTYSEERKGDPFKLHDPDREFTLAVIADAYGQEVENEEIAEQLDILKYRARGYAMSSKAQSEKAHLMKGIRPAMELNTFGGDGLTFMFDVVVAIQLTKEIYGMAGDDGDEGAGGESGDKPKVAETIGRSVTKHPVMWSLGAIGTVVGAVMIVEKINEDDDDDPPTVGAGGTSTIINISNNSGPVVFNYAGDDSGSQNGDDGGNAELHDHSTHAH